MPRAPQWGRGVMGAWPLLLRGTACTLGVSWGTGRKMRGFQGCLFLKNPPFGFISHLSVCLFLYFKMQLNFQRPPLVFAYQEYYSVSTL